MRPPQTNDDGAYGAAFADVYDDWYADVTDVDATVETLLRLSSGGSLLELGVGTGRIAVPLAARLQGRAQLVGIDNSEAMLDVWRAKLDVNPIARSRSTVLCGDMAAHVDRGRYSVVFCTFNTFFNLPTHDAQRWCLRNAAESLTPGGAVVLEFAVFADQPNGADISDGTGVVEVREMSPRPDGSEVTSVSRIDRANHTADGTYVDADGRERSWSIRWATPSMIDEMAREAGLVCVDRWEDFSRRPIRPGSVRQVCVMRRRLKPT